MIAETAVELRCEALQVFDEGVFQSMLSLESLFPEKIKEGKDKVRENISNPRNIKIVMRENDLIVGCALAIPHNDAFADLSSEDPFMVKDDFRFYVDKIAVISRLRKGVLFLKLVEGIFEEARKRNVFDVSSHILCSNGLDKVIALMYRKRITKKRFIYLPSYGNAKFMYVDVKFG